MVLCGKIGVDEYSAGWTQLSNTNLRSVGPPNTPDGYPFYDNCQAVINAWGGGAYDTLRRRLLIWGGGHGDYGGNELYSLALSPVAISRLTDPHDPPELNVEANSDGTPNSRHTYGGLEYLANVDRYFVFGGSLYSGSGGFSDQTWTFDPSTSLWTQKNPSGTNPGNQSIPLCAYDPVSHLVYMRTGIAFFSYDYASNVWTRLINNDTPIGTDYDSCVIDPIRRLYIIIGASGVHTISIDDESDYVASAEIETSGPQTIITDGRSPGAAYHTPSGKIACWDGSDSGTAPSSVFVLDPADWSWTAHQYSSGPGQNLGSRGTFGHWRYDATADVFVITNNFDQNSFVFKLP
jgi:hypothetical protein